MNNSIKCEAKINDRKGSNFKCLCDATKEITIETFAPHLNAKVKKVRRLCSKHSSALLKRHRYKIKHRGKQTDITVTHLT
jgi:hypothetical protein